MGGAVIVVVWGFLEVFPMEPYVVVGTLNHCGCDGIAAEQNEVGMGVCV